MKLTEEEERVIGTLSDLMQTWPRGLSIMTDWTEGDGTFTFKALEVYRMGENGEEQILAVLKVGGTSVV